MRRGEGRREGRVGEQVDRGHYTKVMGEWQETGEAVLTFHLWPQRGLVGQTICPGGESFHSVENWRREKGREKGREGGRQRRRERRKENLAFTHLSKRPKFMHSYGFM